MVSRAPEINFRQNNIIRELLRTNSRITLSDLAEKTNLNARIIRYNMQVVQSWLTFHGVHFINKPGYGVEVVASQEAKDQLLEKINILNNCDIILSRSQRERIILLYLLTSPAPVAAKHVSEIENFSRSTVFKDICEVEAWLRSYSITLHKQSSKGLWIEGWEESRRFALVRLIREELGDSRWLRLFDYFQDHNEYRSSTLPQRMVAFINSLTLDFSHALVRYIEENTKRVMSIKSRVEIMVYLGITMQAIQTENTIQGTVEPAVRQSDEYAIAQVLGYQIEKKNGASLNAKETELIAALIMGSRWENQCSRRETGHFEKQTPPASPKSQGLAQDIINICSMRLHPMLKIDPLLSDELTSHLDYSLFRLKYHIPIRNAFLQDIREKYPKIYRVAESSIFLMENEVGEKVPEEEIGFIAMYLLSGLERLRTEEDSRINAIIANDGVRAKSSLLQSRIEYEFPSLRVVGTINTAQHSALEGHQADLIISTLPIENASIPVIEVHPFLEIEDLKAIQRWITKKNQNKRKQSLHTLKDENSLVDLIKLPNITFKNKVKSWREMVAAASQPLIQDNSIQERYLQAMIDLIQEHGFYMHMGSGVLLLHAKPTDGVNQLSMSMLRLRHPLTVKTPQLAETDLVFVLGAKDDHSHLTALFQLNELIQYPDCLASIRAAKKPSKVIHILWQCMPQLQDSPHT